MDPQIPLYAAAERSATDLLRIWSCMEFPKNLPSWVSTNMGKGTGKGLGISRTTVHGPRLQSNFEIITGIRFSVCCSRRGPYKIVFAIIQSSIITRNGRLAGFKTVI